MDKKDIDVEHLLPKSVDTAILITPNKEEKKRSSCTLCKVFLYVTLGVIGFAVLAGISAYKMFERQVIRFTVTNPISYEVNIMEDSECTVEKDRINLFFDMLNAGDEPDTDLSVSGAVINGCLIGKSDYLRGNAMVALEENNLRISMSLPAYFLPGGYNRYFVAQANVDIAPSVTHGPINDVTSFSAEVETLTPVDGIDDPLAKIDMDVYEDVSGRFEFFLRYGKFANWFSSGDEHVDGLYDDPNMANVLWGIEGISFQHGIMTIQARHSDKQGANNRDEEDNFRKKLVYYSNLVSAGSNGVRRLVGFS